MDINCANEHDLSPEETSQFTHNKVISLMETMAKVNEENYSKLANLGILVVVILYIGHRSQHAKVDKTSSCWLYFYSLNKQQKLTSRFLMVQREKIVTISYS